ncbi:Low temperature requirement protein LtrA [Micromonospora nigra]|uniref:Low temperature requirement protein LtrA n=1 Tax=Micromonospora nigra TaxID=145857 RepID=A0A1C6SN89_9ACTN|nr:low temperature requirement protein A [Micromonospora nigra]SCL31061.1 Low temperature requirement protein LtrA [Micromonospora nigra]
MAGERGAALLRPAGSHPRATFLELFFDLVFVFALTRVSQRLIDDIAGGPFLLGVVHTLMLLLALWLVWSITTWVTSRYEPDRLVIQGVVVGTMFGALVMAVALPRAFEERSVWFAGAYLTVMIGRPLVVAAALGGHPRREVPLRLAAWASAGGVPWLVGAFGPEELRLPLWVVALAVDSTGALLGWPLPRWGPARTSGWRIAGEHLAERYQQIFLISLGETILVIGLTFSGRAFSGPHAGAFAVAFVTTALLWRIYFHRAGHLLAEALRLARSPGHLGASAGRTHLFIILGVLSTGVGYELVIVHPFGRIDATWLVFIVGGPAIFLLARARFEYEIFNRVSVSRVVAVLVLALVGPVLALGTPMLALTVVAVVLTGVAVTDAVRSRGRPPERAASPLGRTDSPRGRFSP